MKPHERYTTHEHLWVFHDDGEGEHGEPRLRLACEFCDEPKSEDNARDTCVMRARIYGSHWAKRPETSRDGELLFPATMFDVIGRERWRRS